MTQIYKIFTHLRMQKQMNIDLKCLYKWLLANKISLNCSKTELVIFHKPGYPIRNFNFNIKINGHKIIPTDHIKYLGIYIDSTLSGSYHCEILSNKLTRAIECLAKFDITSRKKNLNRYTMQYFHPTWCMAVKHGVKEVARTLKR